MKDKQKKRRNGKNSIRSIQIKSLIERSDKINSFKESIIIVIWYGIFGFLWILMTDAILNWLISDPIQYRNAQLVKGWLYVFLTIVFIFLVVKRRIDLIKNFIDDVVATNIVLDKTEEELYIQNAFTDEIIGSAPVIIAIWDEEGSLKSVNPYALEVLGYDATSVFYQEWMELLFSEENKASLLSVYEIVRKDEHLKNHGTELITKDGRIVNILWNGGTLNLNRAGKYEYVSFGVDVTELKKAEDQWKHLAYNDYLTDLPNRVSLEQEVTKRFFTASDPFVLLYLDVDNFKYINDSLGHNVGDELLKHISKCLKKKITTPHYVARLGGDEFAIIVDKYKDKDQVIQIVEKIKKEIGNTWFIYNHNFYISLSIGASVAWENGHDFNTLSKNADIAMYSSKKEGKDRLMFFEEAIENDNLYHIEMAKKIQKAINNAEFELYYQPLYSLFDQKISGLEALIRWNESERGFISPGEFIPLAEDSGQIYAIERWVFKQALTQKLLWDEMGYDQICLSINLSSKTIMSDVNFLNVEIALQEYSGDLSKIMIEITETASIKDIHNVIQRLNRLKKLGVRIALDDFGTGYSSLTHIKLLPIDVVKLDRSFINQIQNKGKDELIVNSVILLVKKLGYELVAEGIENILQLDYLIENHCEFGQGFYMCRPKNISDINLLLSKSKEF